MKLVLENIHMAIISIVSMAITAGVMLIGGRIIYGAFSKTREKIYLYFALSFLGYGIMHIFLTVGAYFSGINPQVAGIMYSISHVFLFFSIALFLRVPFKLIWFQKERFGFYVVLGLALIGSILLFVNTMPIPIATPQGLTAWNIPASTAKIVAILTTLMLLFGIILFVLSARRAKKKVHKIRGYLLALGVLVFLIAGPTHNFVRTTAGILFADALTPIGALIMLVGIYLPHTEKGQKELRDEKEEKPKETQNN